MKCSFESWSLFSWLFSIFSLCTFSISTCFLSTKIMETSKTKKNPPISSTHRSSQPIVAPPGSPRNDFAYGIHPLGAAFWGGLVGAKFSKFATENLGRFFWGCGEGSRIVGPQPSNFWGAMLLFFGPKQSLNKLKNQDVEKVCEWTNMSYTKFPKEELYLEYTTWLLIVTKNGSLSTWNVRSQKPLVFLLM